MIKYKHYKKQGDYYIVDHCLIQENNIWIDAVTYKKVGSHKKFTRSEKEFNLKFEMV